MEEVFQRFPHIGEKIIHQLNNATLTDCRMVNTFWRSSVDSQKVLWRRVIYRWIAIRPEWQEIFKVLNVDMVRILANAVHQFYTDDSDEVFKTPLEFAAIIGNTEIVAKFFKKGAFENQTSSQDKYGLPFHIAAEYGHFNVCQFFIENIHDMNPKDNHKMTPLHLAARNGHFLICRMILEKIGDKKPSTSNDIDGYTPLHEAAENNHLAICRLIMKFVSDKSPKDKIGRTPLHYASENGHLAVCLYILNNAKAKNLKDQYGETPLHLAVEKDHTEI